LASDTPPEPHEPEAAPRRSGEGAPVAPELALPPASTHEEPEPSRWSKPLRRLKRKKAEASGESKEDDPGEVWLRRRRRRRIALGVLLVLVWWFIPSVWRLGFGTVTVTRYERKAGEVQATVGPGAKGWISVGRVSKHVLYAIVSAEDGKFYEHHGLDLGEIKESIRLNWKRGRYARGGSTITQQVVKMAFLGREKTILRKAREAVGAVLVELIYPKDKILEWYINLAEFGDGVYGISEGAAHYFRTKPELLTIEQGVHLALVLPSPNAWSKGLRRRSLTPFGHRRFATILNRMRQSGYITRQQWASAVSRGDFGRPLTGYTRLIAAEESQKLLCPGNPGCPEVDEPEEEETELSYPPPRASGSAAGTVTSYGGSTKTSTSSAMSSEVKEPVAAPQESALGEPGGPGASPPATIPAPTLAPPVDPAAESGPTQPGIIDP
jgi:monofunctional biosynthetic peptidoglycan transglycosylase